jgi:D-alanyl-D-alanine dipeptidase
VRLPPTVQPLFDPSTTYGDCTGKAIDRSPDNSIDMGTSFDCFDVMSHAGFAALSPEQRQSRALLRSVMKKYGFEDYGREWWHFTFAAGTRRGPRLDFVIAPAQR